VTAGIPLRVHAPAVAIASSPQAACTQAGFDDLDWYAASDEYVVTDQPGVPVHDEDLRPRERRGPEARGQDARLHRQDHPAAVRDTALSKRDLPHPRERPLTCGY